MNSTKITNIYGVSENTTYYFKNEIGFNKRKKISQKKSKHSFKILNLLEKNLHGDKLKETTRENISFLIKIKTNRGLRHRLKYPTRGQRTHTNGRTRKKTRG